MSDLSLDAVFSNEPAPAPAEAQAEPVVEQESGVEDVGTPPTEEAHEQQGDPIARKQKGLEAAAVAERQKRQAAEQRAQQLEAQLRELQQPRTRPESKPAAEPVRPRRDAFGTVEEYEDALLEYGDQRRELRQQHERAMREAQEQEEQRTRTANEVITRGQTVYTDFDDVINAGIGDLLQRPEPKAGLFRDALLNGERAHDVAYYLGKHPDEARQIYAMPPMQMVRAVALIEATKLQQEDQAEQLEQPVKPAIPRTLTQARDSRSGQFKPAAYQGPTPLDDILAPKKRA